MDGFAFAKDNDISQNSTLDIVGESCAGNPYDGELQPNQGVRIFTGAVVPSTCDTVVMQENTNFSDIQATLDKSKPYQITLATTASIGANIRKQGEEVQTGETVLTTGKRLNPTDISLLANLGVAQIKVAKPLTVGIIATGDELVQLGEPLQHLAQIYNSNTPTLKTLLKDLPISIKDYGIVPDSLDATRQTVKNAIADCDVIISSAGVSVGDYDFLTTVIDDLGKINHYKVAMKPGKPFVFGEFGGEFAEDNKQVLYFGLPGNPLSTVVGCLQFIKPALWRLSGVVENDIPMQLRLSANTTHDIKKQAGRQDYQRASFVQNEDGSFSVTPLSAQDSHRVKQLSQANCLLVLPKDNAGVKAGESVVIEPFAWNF
ncbi:PREDICTED: uncharacterized protein LOC109279551 [Aptenodytes forsteri]|uniref:uncharacterized protein LOC109279551 n=1 Tax=Aptenodytes forsteri TaxID=9233 RepID=UPI0009056AFE|nr:PREDICTED: uncharacterized protein LOC109279551 [Aptenodytes forsteri]